MSGDDNDGEARTASVALAVALAALTIAVTQLLGQLLATADGYRRCQPSVMGGWAQYTRLRWRWSQMRFETLFTTPDIMLMNFTPDTEPLSNHCAPTQGSRETYWIGEAPGLTRIDSGRYQQMYRKIDGLTSKFIHKPSKTEMHDEMACWLPFLSSLRDIETHLEFWIVAGVTSTQHHTVRRPACGFVRRSWDFMAPELVRPLAVTNIGDIAVMVQHLGMEWKTFRPESGEMRAEGNGHIIYSTLDRSIGPILHYVHAQSWNKPLGQDLKYTVPPIAKFYIIPTQEADMMRFGILPCCPDLMRCRYYKIGTIDEVTATLDALDPTASASKKIRDNRQFEATATYGFSDMIPMAAPMLKQKGNSLVRLPVPMEHCIGLCSLEEGFVVFRQRLGEHIEAAESSVPPHILWVRKMYDNLQEQNSWEKGLDGLLSQYYSYPHKDNLNQIHDVWEETTAYFKKLVFQKGNENIYEQLVACHIKHAVNFWHEAHERVRENRQRDDHGLVNWLTEGMHLYWDYLPSIAAELAPVFNVNEEVVQEAWIMLIFRAFCWSRCHYMCKPHERFPESMRLPSKHWNSKLPVYLG